MATLHERHRNNVKAGVFVTAAILLGMTVVAVLKDAVGMFLTPRTHHAVTFTVEAGVQALTGGSIVRIGGIEMGRVTDVVIEDLLDGPPTPDHESEQPGEFRTIVVFFELNSRVPLYSNAVATVKGSLIGSDAWIEITTVGHALDLDPKDGVPDGRLLAPDRTDDRANWLRGADAGTLLASVLGVEGAKRAGEIIDNVAAITGDVRRDWSEYIRPTLASARDGVADFRSLMDRVDSDWASWAVSVDQILVNVLSASDTIELAANDGRTLIRSAQSGVDQLNAMVGDNRPSIDAFIANLNAASADVRDVADRIANDTMHKVEALIDRGRDGLDSFARAAARVDLEVDALAPDLRDSMANLQIASTELSLAMTEIRASPWRLLYRPSTEELEHENLYFAASKFALASSELKIASQTVDRAIANHREYLGENPQRLEELQRMLAESMNRYAAAQEELLSILKDGDAR
jgi:ABC-type transporter Mla subunit MlaD